MCGQGRARMRATRPRACRYRWWLGFACVEVLQVLWDGGGNVPPQLAIARTLVERGHRVRILGHRCQRDRAEATGASFRAYRHAPDADASRPETDLIRDWEARTPLGAFANARDRL